MPTLKDWENYFKSLSEEQRQEIWQALDTILSYSMFDMHYTDLRTLRFWLERMKEE